MHHHHNALRMDRITEKKPRCLHATEWMARRGGALQ